MEVIVCRIVTHYDLHFVCDVVVPYAVRTLVEVKKSFLNGEHELQDWDSGSQSPCTWKGVTCNNLTFEVTGL